jgi:hypothetical protein
MVATLCQLPLSSVLADLDPASARPSPYAAILFMLEPAGAGMNDRDQSVSAISSIRIPTKISTSDN